MAVSSADRVRVTLDLLKDGVIVGAGGDAQYNNLDKATQQVAMKYVQAFWDTYGPETEVVNGVTTPIANPTNAQLAEFFMKQIRLFIRDVYKARQSKVAATTASVNALAAANAEVDADLGV